jgi:hypothetical protein
VTYGIGKLFPSINTKIRAILQRSIPLAGGNFAPLFWQPRPGGLYGKISFFDYSIWGWMSEL